MNTDNDRPIWWICTNPGCPHEHAKKFNDWVRKNLPSSKTGFLPTDLDFIIYNYKIKKIMLLEIKTHNKEPKQWQKILFSQVSNWLELGIKKDNSGWQYLGFHTIKFEESFFNDGKVYFDGKESSEEEIRETLSLF